MPPTGPPARLDRPAAVDKSSSNQGWGAHSAEYQALAAADRARPDATRPGPARLAATLGRAVAATGFRPRVVAPGRAAPPDPDVAGAPVLRSAGSSAEPDGGIRGVRHELHRQLREGRRLRMITLTVSTLVVLLALPAFFGIRSAGRDPVFTSLDALSVPAWAAVGGKDDSSGSRWCFLDCRFRERTAQSRRTPAETERTYQQALTDADWQRWIVDQCPEQPVEGYSCWRRDEFTLDLWVREPSCAVDAVAAQEPGVAPTEGVAPAPPDPKLCTGATVSIKVRNAITDERGRSVPQPNPSLIGETPDPILPDVPLLEATPSPS